MRERQMPKGASERREPSANAAENLNGDGAQRRERSEKRRHRQRSLRPNGAETKEGRTSSSTSDLWNLNQGSPWPQVATVGAGTAQEAFHWPSSGFVAAPAPGPSGTSKSEDTSGAAGKFVEQTSTASPQSKGAEVASSPGEFDDAILAALAALPQYSLVNLLCRLSQSRANDVALAFAPSSSGVLEAGRSEPAAESADPQEHGRDVGQRSGNASPTGIGEEAASARLQAATAERSDAVPNSHDAHGPRVDAQAPGVAPAVAPGYSLNGDTTGLATGAGLSASAPGMAAGLAPPASPASMSWSATAPSPGASTAAAALAQSTSWKSSAANPIPMAQPLGTGWPGGPQSPSTSPVPPSAVAAAMPASPSLPAACPSGDPGCAAAMAGTGSPAAGWPVLSTPASTAQPALAAGGYPAGSPVPSAAIAGEGSAPVWPEAGAGAAAQSPWSQTAASQMSPWPSQQPGSWPS